MTKKSDDELRREIVEEIPEGTMCPYCEEEFWDDKCLSKALKEIEELREENKDFQERFPVNICPECGHVGDFWFDRSMVNDEHGNEIEGMAYRCRKCGVNVDKAENDLKVKIKELEAKVERLEAQNKELRTQVRG